LKKSHCFNEYGPTQPRLGMKQLDWFMIRQGRSNICGNAKKPADAAPRENTSAPAIEDKIF
jgi:hypothetical protein